MAPRHPLRDPHHGPRTEVRWRFFGRGVGPEDVAPALGVGAVKAVQQVHGARCLTITDAGQDTGTEDADALATAAPGVALAVRTADCAPVLLWDAAVPAVAAAHAGWRGALAGALEAALGALAALGARDIRAAIGPCIGPASYAVSPGFEAPFIEEDPCAATFFRDGRFDLPGYAAFRLARAGVTRIAQAGADTFAQSEHFHSFRRDGAAAGRQISAICIAP
ncbi:MAG TPA: polyphenol oxidase [Rhodospirillaceae bacterium]|nr:polyphenol oxidase family protein [Alphaproteobacteria bacterium]HBH26437.1 polyphenol oxidase [Rhodospirillaceae bacterium]